MERLIKLTDDELALIAKADAQYTAKSRATRLYTILRNRRNNDIAFIYCAVKFIRRVRQVKVIAATSVDSKQVVYSAECALLNTFLYGTRFKVGWRETDLLPNGDNPPYHSYGSMYWFNKESHNFHWTEQNADEKEHTWKLGEPLNESETLAANPRFRYCTPPHRYGFHLLKWLRRYAAAPEIENLSKMGIEQLAEPRFVAELKADKSLFAYIRQNIDGVRRHRMSCSAVRFAHRHNLTPDESVRRRKAVNASAKLKRAVARYAEFKLPKGFPAQAAVNYLDKTDISEWEYCRYLRYCHEAEANLLDPHTAFPHNLEARLKAFDEAERKRRERERRREAAREAAEARSRNQILRELAQEYAKRISRLKLGGFVAVFPDSSSAFVKEGSAMGNCIGGGNYTIRHADHQCVCVFLREAAKPNKPFVDLEIVDGKVRQCYAKENSQAPDEVRRVADRIAKSLFRNSKMRKAA